MSGLFGKFAVVLVIAGLFYVGSGLRVDSELPMLTARPAHANVAVAGDNIETVITASEDGRTVYIWRYFGVKPPKYLGKAEANPNR